MTKEEASFILSNIDLCDEEVNEALDIAIKALEQEPCEDAVSRQAVAKALLKYAHSTEGKAFAEFLVSQINDLQSVTPQPKTGHWIDDGVYAEGHSHKAFHCSKCGHNVLGFEEDLSNYCPSCGCKMEVE